MSRQWEAFASGVAAAWLDHCSGGLVHAMRGGCSTWWTGYRSLFARPVWERGRYVLAVIGASGRGAGRGPSATPRS